MTSGVYTQRNKSLPENRRKTGEANLERGAQTRFKPGQSGNPGGRPRTAKISEACRTKLASLIPGDVQRRTYAQAIADKLVQLALKGDIRAAQELADRAEGKPGHGDSRVEDSSRNPVVIVTNVKMPDPGIVRDHFPALTPTLPQTLLK